jgi:hypothetical protein
VWARLSCRNPSTGFWAVWHRPLRARLWYRACFPYWFRWCTCLIKNTESVRWYGWDTEALSSWNRCCRDFSTRLSRIWSGHWKTFRLLTRPIRSHWGIGICGGVCLGFCTF